MAENESAEITGKFIMKHLLMCKIAAFCLLFAIIFPAVAWGQRDPNRPPAQVPPAGIEIAPAARTDLQTGLAALDKLIAQLTKSKSERTKSLLPDVEVCASAVRTALEHNEFFAANEVAKAKELLQLGTERAQQLLENQ